MKNHLPAPLSLFVFLFSLFAAALCAAAPFSPLQIGIDGEDLQLVDAHTPVIGLRLNLPVPDSDYPCLPLLRASF